MFTSFFRILFWVVEKTFGIGIVILIYVNMCKYLYILLILSQPKAFGPVTFYFEGF